MIEDDDDYELGYDFFNAPLEEIKLPEISECEKFIKIPKWKCNKVKHPEIKWPIYNNKVNFFLLPIQTPEKVKSIEETSPSTCSTIPFSEIPEIPLIPEKNEIEDFHGVHDDEIAIEIISPTHPFFLDEENEEVESPYAEDKYDFLYNIAIFGEVYKATAKGSDDIYAIKRMRFQQAFKDPEFKIDLTNEVYFLKRLRHQNVVTMIETLRSKNCLGKDVEQPFIVLEFVPFDLASLFRDENFPRKFDDDIKCAIGCQLFQAIEFIHQKMILHLDLKPSNVLITREGVVKLCDFERTQYIGQALPAIEEAVGNQIISLLYRPPEIFLGASLNSLRPSVDIWSMGCIFAQLWTHIPIFRGNCEIEVFRKIVNFSGPLSSENWRSVEKMPLFLSMIGMLIKKEEFCSMDIYDEEIIIRNENALSLVQHLLQLDPKKRPSATSILSIPTIIYGRSVIERRSYQEFFSKAFAV